jgi:AcrR family transcriptional regulator
MENMKKAKRKPDTSSDPKEQLIKAYREFVLIEGKRPTSVYSFTKASGMKEEDFYAYFGSFDALEKSLWQGYIEVVKERLTRDETYATYSAREKILAFFFTLAEILKNDRSFVLHQLNDLRKIGLPPSFLKGFKTAFEEWINPILMEGKQTGEIAMRPYLDTKYDSVFWMHLLFVLQFWSKDDSANFEKTDMAIEKSVNLAFDLLGKGVLDSAIDFGKFLYQNR